MTKDKWIKLSAWITACILIFTGMLLIIACNQIYSSGSRPYTPEAIAAEASGMAVTGYLCLVLVILGLLLLPAFSPTQKCSRDDYGHLRRYRSDLPQAQKERKYRFHLRIATAAVLVLLNAYPLIYFCDLSHFTIESLTDNVLRGIIIALIPAGLSMIVSFLFRILDLRSISREIEIRRSAGEKPGKHEIAEPSGRRLLIVRLGVLAVSLAFIVLGILNGGIADVLGKAIRICTECIGLG